MSEFHYQQHQLYVEQMNVADIAKRFGTPCYIYSRASIVKNWQAFDAALVGMPHRIYYAVKANSNLAILQLLAQLNSGFDIVSIGELERVLAAGGDSKKIVFSGVAKKTEEMIRALEVGIACFNVESEAELHRLQRVAKAQNKIAKIALRVNPNIDAKTHPYIATGLHENKFGIALEQVFSLCQEIKHLTHIELTGIACHIGSQLTELNPFLEAVDCLINLVKQLAAENIYLKNINIGGGLGVRYHEETPPAISDYIQAIREKLSPYELELHIEPGRAIVANAGILLTRVEFIKETEYKNFAIIDAGMNDLIRPALYDAWQQIIPVNKQLHVATKTYDIVGPVCESADFLGKQRTLSLQQNDLLAVCSAGAYGFSMSSNYNSRPRPAEILIDGDQIHLIRQRESIRDLFAHESLI